MGPTTYQQFIRFTTDAYGLERTFRLLQAIVQIFSSYSVFFNLLLFALQALTGAAHPPSPATTHVVLLGLRGRLALARRYFRTFRFMDSFHTGYKIWTNLNAEEEAQQQQQQQQQMTAQDEKNPTAKPQEIKKRKKKASWRHATTYLDMSAATFNGMYLLLETSTLVDALQVDGLRIFSPPTELRVNIEAQRFWLFALVCAAASGLLRMVEVAAYTPVPATGDGFGHGQDEGVEDKEKTEKEEEKKKKDGGDDDDEFDVAREQARLRRIVTARRAGRVVWRRDVTTRLRRLARSVTACLIDMVLPGSFVGWLDVSPGAVGVATLVTTFLTSVDIWERCGREAAAR